MHVKRKTLKSIKKINVIWTFENKVHLKTFKNIFLGVKILFLFFCMYGNFSLIYHILSPYKITQKNFMIKNLFI